MRVDPQIVASRCSLGIIALDTELQELAAAIASSSIAVGSRCPHVAVGVAALTSQGFTNPRLGELTIDLLRLGLTAAEVLQALRQHDRWIDYRQVAIVTVSGEAAVHTGSANVGWAGHAIGEGVVCLANGLADGSPVEAMLKHFTGSLATPFAQRLIDSLVVGREMACGAEGLLSASLLAATPARRRRLDLRIDIASRPLDRGGDALAELHALHDRFRPIAEFYEQWPDNPNLANGNWREWADTTQLPTMAESRRRRVPRLVTSRRRK